jgi:DNA-binding MarR family transcriptional regulator
MEREYGESNYLGYRISMTSKRMQAALQHRFRQLDPDLTFEQWTVLLALWRKDGRTQQELSAETGRDQTSLSRLLDTMVRRNLIVRVQSREDRRINLIYLTYRGKELERPLLELAGELQAQALQGIGEDELSVFLRVLNRIDRNMN